MVTDLWLLCRWMAETIVERKIENTWFDDFPDDAKEFLFDVGQDLLLLFG